MGSFDKVFGKKPGLQPIVIHIKHTYLMNIHRDFYCSLVGEV